MYLDSKTCYSFCFGTFSAAGLVENGVSGLALCTVNCTYDHWEFVKRCREAGIKPILGADVRNDSGEELEQLDRPSNWGAIS